MKKEKKRDRREILDQLPVFPRDSKGRPKKFTLEEANNLYDLLEKSYDERQEKIPSNEIMETMDDYMLKHYPKKRSIDEHKRNREK